MDGLEGGYTFLRFGDESQFEFSRGLVYDINSKYPIAYFVGGSQDAQHMMPIISSGYRDTDNIRSLYNIIKHGTNPEIKRIAQLHLNALYGKNGRYCSPLQAKFVTDIGQEFPYPFHPETED